MHPRVLHFATTQTRRRPIVSDPTKHTINRLMNDLQIIAITMPAGMEWLSTLVHELAEQALVQQQDEIAEQRG